MSAPALTTPAILALDTAGESCSAALLCNGEKTLLIERGARRHAQQILPLCDALLRQADIGIQQLDAIAVNSGPGSFTGLRIGMSAAQGLAVSANLPVVAVSGLQALALAAFAANPAHRGGLLTLIDARMDEVYAAWWKCTDSGPQRLADDMLSSPDQLCPISELCWADVIVYGSGTAYLSRIAGANDAALAERGEGHSAAQVLEIAAPRFLAGDYVSADAAEPVYLRHKVTG